MIREEDVNGAMIQAAAEELEVGVPIRSWRVEDGQLVLCLAYGGEVRWGDRAEEAEEEDRPWEFVEKFQASNLAPIPKGDLEKLSKQKLQMLALQWGFQTKTLRPLKAEYVEAVTWLRDGLGRLERDLLGE